MDKYNWICGIVILAVFHGLLGTSALSCNQCVAGEDCRLVKANHRMTCPADHTVCLSSVELDNRQGWLYWSNPTIKFSRSCAKFADSAAVSRPLLWASGKKECRYTEEGSSVKMDCWCNTDNCNSQTDFHLPSGQTIRTSAAASLFTTGAIATLFASCAMSLLF